MYVHHGETGITRACGRPLAVRLQPAGSVPDPAEPIGRLLLNLLAMFAELTGSCSHDTAAG